MTTPIYFSLHLLENVQFFARGGGGGSGGGGSGGGGSGGGGGGIFVVIGYLPPYYVTSWFNRHVSKPVAIIMGSLTAIAVTGVCALIGPFFAFIIAICAIVGVHNGLNNIWAKMAKRMKRTSKSVAFAASKDPAWQEATIQQRIATVFDNFQKDWSNFAYDNIRAYTTQRYFDHVKLMLQALQEMGRRNAVNSPQLNTYGVTNINDNTDNELDNFETFIDAKANDQLIDVQANEVIYTDNSEFTEFWQFDREGEQWMLDGIAQTTASKSQADRELEEFAQSNGMYYSLDWGWLLLPKRGQLFSKANFKKSDVNNHVIGDWNNHIVQLYTYIPDKNSNAAQNYLIGQINLPKSYGGIVIKRKDGFRSLFGKISGGPNGYNKVSMEWPDFNKRYDVYATDVDQVTAFELLNPSFMADLYDRDVKVSIEVVDNVVYLYTLTSKFKAQYIDMLEVLRRAHKELKL